MNFTEYIQFVANQLKNKLPGKAAQQIMSPSQRPKGHESYDESSARESAVLILLYPHEGEVYSVVMQRPTYNGTHSGQISYPGGKREPSDSSLAITALREAHEELNIEPEQVEIIGHLTPLYIPHSNFMVYPFVGYSNERPHFIKEEKEVAEIVEFPFKRLFETKTHKETVLPLSFGDTHVPYYDIKGKMLWGASAMITSELEQCLIV